MRLVLLILTLGLFSFSTPFSPDPAKNILGGNWVGAYGNTEVINHLSLVFVASNQIRLSGNYGNAIFESDGTYQLTGDSTITITCRLFKNINKNFVLKGLLNKPKTFTDGEWEITGTTDKGSFYLQKNNTTGY